MVEIENLGRQIDEISEQLQPEEKARFRRQREAEHLKLLAAGRRHLELQALPIGNPDPIPQRSFRKKKTHGKADARALTGTEIAERDHAAREAALVANATRKEADATPPGTPPQACESQTTITIPLRPSPRRAPHAPIRQATLFPGDDIHEEEGRDLPPSTAPPRLEQAQEGQAQEGQAQEGQAQEGQAQEGQAQEGQAQEQGRGKRRKITKKPFEYSTPR